MCAYTHKTYISCASTIHIHIYSTHHSYRIYWSQYPKTSMCIRIHSHSHTTTHTSYTLSLSHYHPQYHPQCHQHCATQTAIHTRIHTHTRTPTPTPGPHPHHTHTGRVTGLRRLWEGVASFCPVVRGGVGSGSK